MSLFEVKIVILRRYVRDPDLTCMKLLTREQKTPTAGASAEWIRLPHVRQQMQNTTPTGGTSAERIRLPGARLQQSSYYAKYRQYLQLQLQLQLRR
jgi:hypothetical protein